MLRCHLRATEDSYRLERPLVGEEDSRTEKRSERSPLSRLGSPGFKALTVAWRMGLPIAQLSARYWTAAVVLPEARRVSYRVERP